MAHLIPNRFVFAVAVLVLIAMGERANAQYFVGRGYNTYTGTVARGGALRNPFTGGYVGGVTSRNMWNGTVQNTTVMRNPSTGTVLGVQRAYNPYTNRFGYRYGFRRW